MFKKIEQYIADIVFATRYPEKYDLKELKDMMVAGVSVISNDGAPGSGAQIRIRGGSSLNASNDPLLVIDGFRVRWKS